MAKYKPKETEEEISNFWSDNSIYQKSKEKRKDGKNYYFNDGPPYTTGSIHLGTAWNKVLKDMVLRYKRMQGFNVRDQPGFDMHGLPIEVKVEEKLKIRNKQEIFDKLGMDGFIEECRDFALKNLDKMVEQFKELGVWMDWDNPYRTIDNSYIEGAWWALKKAFEKDKLYKGPKVVTWCSRCATALAKHELNYKNVEENSVFVKFKLEEKENEYILVWTTTPWTLPSNMFVAVHPDLDYVRIKVEDEIWILARDLVPALMGVIGKDYEIIDEFKGTELHGLDYVHPFLKEMPRQKELKEEVENAHKVLNVGEDIFHDFVNLSAGTGCVHSAPGTGPEDFEVGKHYNIPAFCPVDENGKLNEDAGKYEGLRTKKEDDKIVKDLREKGVLIYENEVEHEYPHCWRCKNPVIFRATEQWYLAVSDLKDELIEENEKINWTPSWAGSKWLKDWLENLQDWCISRQRFWGIPLPIWECKNGHRKVVGSRDELGGDVDDLHRPWIDEVTFECEECGEKMERISDILDVWLDSGAAIWASLGFPKDEEKFKKWWPADFIAEGKDQIRGWFSSLLNLSMISHEEAPYESVYMHGFVADKDGLKMSKSVGNIVEPEEVIEEVGADGWRLYCISAANPGEDLRFNWKDLKESYKMLNILWNVSNFAEYMETEDFNPEKYELDLNKLKPEDEWVLSRLNTLKKEVTDSFEAHEFQDVPNLLRDFVVDDLSRWYIKLIRDRTWVSEKGEDKLVAFKVLYKAIKIFLTLSAPVIPFQTEKIYQELIKPMGEELPESIHLLNWPEINSGLIKPETERAMKTAREIVEAARFAREDAEIKLRWPLKELAVEKSGEVENALDEFGHIIKKRANVKKVRTGKLEGIEKEFDSGSVYLDTELTRDVLQEALSREVMRAVQRLRKKEGLNVEDKINLKVSSEHEFVSDAVHKYSKEISEKVGAKELKVTTETIKSEPRKEFEFKDKKIQVSFEKV